MSALLKRLRRALSPHYDVQELIGAGGMAVVFRAIDRSLERPVAIKVLRPEFATVIGAERFVREAKRLANLSHPHLVSVHDAGEADGLHYFVMDFIEASTLAELLQRGRLPPKFAVRIVSGLLEALEVAHEGGLIHRDIKPENIFVQGEHPILGDFGIAKSLDGDEALTKTGALLGTPAYMSPEQAQGMPVGPTSDIYSVGQVLFECLTGRHWPLGASGESMDWSGVPDELRPIIQRALEPLPIHRWPNAGAFRFELSRAGVGAGRSKLAGRIGVAAMALATVIALFLWSGREDPDPTGPLSVALGPCVNEGSAPDWALWLVHDAYYEALHERDLTIRSYSDLESPPEALSMGSSLGVEAVATCSVASADSTIAGTIRLIGVPSGAAVVDSAFMVEVSGLREELDAQVSSFLGDESHTRRPADMVSTDSRVLELYADGMVAFHQRTEDPRRVLIARDLFRRALALDPVYAPALAGLAESYVTSSGRGLEASAAAAFAQADNLANEALEIDSSLAMPYAVKGEVIRASKWSEWDLAEAYFQTAIQLDANRGLARLWYAQWLLSSGRLPQAIAQADSALRTAPYNADLGIGGGLVHYLSGHPDSAEVRLTRTTRDHQNSWEGQLWLVATEIELGRTERALGRLDRVVEQLTSMGQPFVDAAGPLLAAAYAALEEREQAYHFLGLDSRPAPFWNATAYALLEEWPRAFEYLRIAKSLEDEFLPYVDVLPLLRSLRERAEYDDFKAGLEWIDDP